MGAIGPGFALRRLIDRRAKITSKLWLLGRDNAAAGPYPGSTPQKEHLLPASVFLDHIDND
ncbi:hypothetical protein H8A95_17160 [Bradyrhizobium sp. Pear76]|uniref:hypothetical protein n=1 Tax=Bradyrhizobium oropedii TaxID=1571201 RepID=UPI001E57BF35|nr:hypothetical protein [Bradyrhizobium oropedii]MCC8963998.1 hypothetical protein [Bradyrhizobium oropedii]